MKKERNKILIIYGIFLLIIILVPIFLYRIFIYEDIHYSYRVLRGEYYFPATNALWFYAPGDNNNCMPTWWEQRLSGKYKNHCFYIPDEGICNTIH